MSTGFGSGPWGSDGWGSSFELLSEVLCDLFGFESCDSMPDVLASPIVTSVGTSEQLEPGSFPGTCDLVIRSGDSSDPLFPQTVAYLNAVPTSGVPNEYTIELTVRFNNLPNDFSNIGTNHFAFQVVSPTGPCVAIFVSKAGLAFAGAFHYVPDEPAAGTLVLDSGLMQIPSTAALIAEDIYITFRAVVSGVSETVYLYATPTAQLGLSGHHLVAVLPAVDASELAATPAENKATISAVGTSAQPTWANLDRWCLSSQLVIPNIAPVAVSGQDVAARLCSIVRLDGSESFDPEGAPLLYSWRLVDGPPQSEFVDEGFDGRTFPEVIPTSLTDHFYSATLSQIESVDPILNGDVLAVDGEPHTIVSKGSDTNGFYVLTALADLPDNLNNKSFKLARARTLSDADTAKPLFFPDVVGFYRFDLTVNDGFINSTPTTVIVNVVESPLPRGCTPSTQFLFNYLSDFWNLVEDSERIATLWDGIAQVTATELFTLWQHEYNKSLRDVQRTFVRRWLHYDLLLPEPLPELTKIRAVWSGLLSSPISEAGDPGLSGTELVLTSSVFGTAVLPINGSSLPSELARELTNRLQEVDSRLSVSRSLSTDGTSSVLRINAPFDLLVDAGTTLAVFTFGTESISPSGTGSAVGVRTYVVDQSLEGVGIQENDLLTLNTGTYRIVRVVSGPTDTYPFQRLIVKEDIPLTSPVEGSGLWTIGSTVKSELLDFYNGLVSNNDAVFFEIASDSDLSLTQVKAVGVNESLPDVLAFDLKPLRTAVSSTAVVRLAKILRKRYLPVSPLISEVPLLQKEIKIVDAEAVLRQNLDFFVEEFRGAKCLRFTTSSIYQDSLDIWEGLNPPDRLWAEYTYVDNSAVIEANFGLAAGLSVDSLSQVDKDVDYLSAVRGLWYAYFKGPRPYSLRVGAQIFLGLPFAEEAGVIEEIRSEFSATYGRILIRDAVNTEIVRSYRYPKFLDLETNPDTGAAYVVGDSVKQFAPLVRGVEYVDWVNNPTWFSGLVQQGVISEAQKYHTFSISIDSRVFSLPALSLVRDFILKAKATYDYPLFVVQFIADENNTDIDVVDEIVEKVTLHLADSTCGSTGAPIFDDPRPGGAGASPPDPWWNHFDTDSSDATPAPVPFNPDSGISWGFDSGLLCPSDNISALLQVTLASPAVVRFDSGILSFDTPITTYVALADTVTSIPAAPGTHVAAGTGTSPFNGNIYYMQLRLTGSDASVVRDYELILSKNGSSVKVVPFIASSHNTVVQVAITPTIGVLTTDTLGFQIRIPSSSSSPGARTPSWSASLKILVGGALWHLDETLPAGAYANLLQLT